LMLRVFGQVRLIVVTEAAAALAVLLITLLLVPSYGAVGGATTLSVVLILQSVAYQVALSRHGIRLLPQRYLRTCVSVVLATLGIQAGQALFGGDIGPSIALVPIASVFVLLFNRDVLDVRTTFPEMLRVPLVRQVLATIGI